MRLSHLFWNTHTLFLKALQIAEFWVGWQTKMGGKLLRYAVPLRLCQGCDQFVGTGVSTGSDR